MTTLLYLWILSQYGHGVALLGDILLFMIFDIIWIYIARGK